MLSGEVELEGWVTSVALLAANYNNTRSNRSTIRSADGDSDADGVDDDVRGEDYNTPRSDRSTVRPVDFFGDDIDEDDETFRVVSRLDAQLQEATATAASSISKRSARTGRNPETEKEITAALDEMAGALSEMRTVLERCSDEFCVAALENVGHRQADLQRAREHVENGEWEAFGMTDGGGDDIILGDYLLPPAAFDPSGLFSAEERAALFRYLSGEPVVGERFTVCLPNAEVPGGNGSIRDAVTPKRLIDYMAGRADGSGGSVYVWGDADSDGDGVGDCDDRDESGSPGEVCGTSEHLAAISGPMATGGSLEVLRGADGSVAVVNSPPEADGGPAGAWVSMDGGSDGGLDLSKWGRATDDVPTQLTQQGRVLGLAVSQMMVQPPGCPRAFPALFYVGRAGSDEQLLYSGGWVVDDAALYEDATTMLTMHEATPVVGIDLGDLDSDGDGFGDAVERSIKIRRDRLVRRRKQRGARLDTGTVGALGEAEILSESVQKAYDDWYVRKKPGRSAGTSGDSVVTHLAIDAFILHLVNAGDASNEVKFKAGAELSK
jgi:hypothetical protein